MNTVNDDALDVLFRHAHTMRKWRDQPVTPQILMAIYDVMRWGPSTNNTNPLRIHFVLSDEAKARLKPHLNRGNVEQTMAAPVTAILAYDGAFYEQMGKLNPSRPDLRDSWAKKPPEETERAALTNAVLQGGYFILAARALGLDCGPMGGFNHGAVDQEFFAGSSLKSVFLCNLGYGAEDGFQTRNPRLAFDEACKIL